MSENGILNLETGDVTACGDEAGVYAALGMQYIPPELRSGLDEIDLALDNAIPVLVESRDLRGDFHMHTTYSDGDDTLEAMIAAAAARGYEYHAISDHSAGRGRRFGMDPAAVRAQRQEIRTLSERYGIQTLCGSEVDILPDGSLDFDDAVLAELDIVIGSVHSAVRQSRDEMTARLIRACENPYRQYHRPSDGAAFRRFPRLRVRLRCGLRGGGADRHGAGNRRTGGAARSSGGAGTKGQKFRRDVLAR